MLPSHSATLPLIENAEQDTLFKELPIELKKNTGYVH